MVSWAASRPIWPAKINSCGISGPTGPLQQEVLNVHMKSWNMLWRTRYKTYQTFHHIFITVCRKHLSEVADGFGWNLENRLFKHQGPPCGRDPQQLTFIWMTNQILVRLMGGADRHRDVTRLKSSINNMHVLIYMFVFMVEVCVGYKQACADCVLCGGCSVLGCRGLMDVLHCLVQSFHCFLFFINSAFSYLCRQTCVPQLFLWVMLGIWIFLRFELAPLVSILDAS